MENQSYQKYYKDGNYIIPEDVLNKLIDENQDLKADYGTLAQIERDVLKDEVKKLNNVIKTYKILLEANDLGEIYKKIDKLEYDLKKYSDILTYVRHLDLYEYVPDYDYEEEIIDNYEPFNLDEFINELLEEK